MLHKFFMLLLLLCIHSQDTHPLFFSNNRTIPDIYLAWGQLCQWLPLYSSIRSTASLILNFCDLFLISKCTVAPVESYSYFWLLLLPGSFGNLILSSQGDWLTLLFHRRWPCYQRIQWRALSSSDEWQKEALIASGPRRSSAWISVKKFQGYKHHLFKSIKTNKNTRMSLKLKQKMLLWALGIT